MEMDLLEKLEETSRWKLWLETATAFPKRTNLSLWLRIFFLGWVVQAFPADLQVDHCFDLQLSSTVGLFLDRQRLLFSYRISCRSVGCSAPHFLTNQPKEMYTKIQESARFNATVVALPYTQTNELQYVYGSRDDVVLPEGSMLCPRRLFGVHFNFTCYSHSPFEIAARRF